MTEPAWLADPTSRHQTRYWDGRAWTGHVADNGVAAFDPPVMAPPNEIARTTFAPPTPQAPSPPQRSGSRARWIVAVAIVAVASIVAVIATRDSKQSTSSGRAGAPSGSGKGVRVEFTDDHGYRYVVEHTGAVRLQRSITNVSPGFAVVHVLGGKMSVANANSGRNAPMPRVRLLAYLPVPDCDVQQSLIGRVETKVSVPDSCLLEIGAGWSSEADSANGMGGIDSLLGAVLKPGQTAVAAVDETWFDLDAASTLPETVDVSGPFAWGIEVVDGDPAFPTSCVIRLVSNNATLLQGLSDEVARINRGQEFNPLNCDVVPG